MHLRAVYVLVIALFAGLTLSANAQQAPPPQPPGITVGRLLVTTTTVTGQPLEFPLFRNQVAAFLLELDPGGQSGPQQFLVPAVVYVLEGTLTAEVEGQPPRVFTAGQAFVPPVNVLANARNRGTTLARFLTVTFGDARKPALTRPAGSAPVGFRFTPVLQATKTITGEDIVFPLLANQFLVLLADFAPGAVAPRHTHPHTQFVYQLEGVSTVEPDGLPPVAIRAGQAFVDATRPHVGANRTEAPGRSFMIFVGEAGTPPTVPAPPR